MASGVHQGRLCRRHADAMVVPQGWWLEDRRSAEQLFSATPPARERGARRAARPARPVAEIVPLPLPAVETPVPVADGEEVDADATPPAWTPTFVADDDLDGLLNATSPLLSRAFGRVKGSGTRQRAPGAEGSALVFPASGSAGSARFRAGLGTERGRSFHRQEIGRSPLDPVRRGGPTHPHPPPCIRSHRTAARRRGNNRLS